MNLQSIVITNSIGFILTLLVLYSSHMSRKGRDLDARMLTALLIAVGSCCLMEMFSFLADGIGSMPAKIVTWASNTWIYMANPAVSILWVLYTDYHLYRKKERLTTVYLPLLILLGACWIIMLGNLFGHYLFDIDENNIYTRKPLAYVFFALPVLILLISVWEVTRYRRSHRKAIFFPIWTFLLPLFTGMILQALIYGVSLGWCCAAIGLGALHMSMQNELAYRDGLTGVYNRHYLNYVLHTWPGNSGIMIDIDLFKEINDRFGHSQGDEALRDVAAILKEAGPEGSIPIRFAGDEFILLLPTNREEEILSTEERIRSAAEAFNQTSCRPYRIGLSMGHSVYHQPTRDKFLEAIDHAMYMDKQLRHESGQLGERRHGEGKNGTRPEDSILYAANYDALTGLPNLSHFFKQSEIMKSQIIGEGKNGILLYIDLNGMKDYNHKYGFAEGDLLLKALASHLARIFGKETCCHSAADRFAVATDSDKLEERLNHLFEEVKRMPKSLPMRVGIYSTEMEDAPVSTAYDRAKIACDTLPLSDESAFCYYSAEIRDVIENRRYIQANLDKAIAEKWIQVYYQPIVRAVNRRICDEEALARWIDPEKGFLSPADFIPYLEASGLIYKLDLYVLEQALEKIRAQREAGMIAVPVSINLSRSDFDACDIVEEIRKRVDEAGEAHSMITIEITESVIGSDFDYMKQKVAQFRELGFPVWMDDFGSGYSTLDVLQSIHFDLIKFDMSFMRKLNEGDEGKIILTDLMRMAVSLGVETICEGVETEDQARFLQEIGCSKLQGFYFFRPLPFEQILDRIKQGLTIDVEDPASSGYFETIGRINLYDLDMIGNRELDSIQNTFDSLPMGIIEIKGDEARFARSNRSYREFLNRFFGIDIHETSHSFVRFGAAFMKNAAKRCGEQGGRTFYDEKMPDGSVIHSFARMIATNPVSGEMALAVAVLSISEPTEGETYADIARALAADYYNIYVVEMDTEKFIEYTSPVGQDVLAVERHGTDFFAAVKRDTMVRIYEEDRDFFLTWFTKENISKALDEQGVFMTNYRLIDTGEPMHVTLKATRLRGTNRIILGVSIVDSRIRPQSGN